MLKAPKARNSLAQSIGLPMGWVPMKATFGLTALPRLAAYPKREAHDAERLGDKGRDTPPPSYNGPSGQIRFFFLPRPRQPLPGLRNRAPLALLRLENP